MSESLDADAALLLSNSPIALWKRYTASGEKALLRYAEAVSQTYPANAPLGQCTARPEQPAEKRLVFHWEALISPKLKSGVLEIFLLLFQGHMRVEHKRLGFQTVHGFSKGGARAAKWRRALGDVVNALSFICFIGAGLVGGVSLLFALVLFSNPSPQEIRAGLKIVGLALACGGAGFALLQLRKKVEVPAALRIIPRYPFRLAKITEA